MHLGVLRVLKQTLEISSVVKDPTQLDPSLVTEVKDSSLTILHQFYLSHRWILQVQGRLARISGGFPAGGAHQLRKTSSICLVVVRSSGKGFTRVIATSLASFYISC
jgi:hypothetical protein